MLKSKQILNCLINSLIVLCQNNVDHICPSFRYSFQFFRFYYPNQSEFLPLLSFFELIEKVFH